MKLKPPHSPVPSKQPEPIRAASAVAMFKSVATTQLKMLFVVILLRNPFRAVPANPAIACRWDLYCRIVLALIAFTAAMLLVMVMPELRIAEAATARATAFAGAKAFDTDHEGIGSVATGWRRRSLRGTLLLAVLLSFAASVLAVVAFEDRFLYRVGCDTDNAGYGSPLGVLMMGLFALLHGFFAWAAVTKN